MECTKYHRYGSDTGVYHKLGVEKNLKFCAKKFLVTDEIFNTWQKGNTGRPTWEFGHVREIQLPLA